MTDTELLEKCREFRRIKDDPHTLAHAYTSLGCFACDITDTPHVDGQVVPDPRYKTPILRSWTDEMVCEFVRERQLDEAKWWDINRRHSHILPYTSIVPDSEREACSLLGCKMCERIRALSGTAQVSMEGEPISEDPRVQNGESASRAHLKSDSTSASAEMPTPSKPIEQHGPATVAAVLCGREVSNFAGQPILCNLQRGHKGFCHHEPLRGPAPVHQQNIDLAWKIGNDLMAANYLDVPIECCVPIIVGAIERGPTPVEKT